MVRKINRAKIYKEYSLEKFKTKTFELGNDPINRTSKLRRLLDAKKV